MIDADNEKRKEDVAFEKEIFDKLREERDALKESR